MQEWYYQTMGQELGPFSAADLKARVDSGQIERDTMVRRGLDGKWLFAERVKGLLPVPPVAEPPVTPLPVKPKSSATVRVMNDSATVPVHGSDQATRGGGNAPVRPVTIAISLDSEEDTSESKPPSVEFYDFVGFREAISPVLNHAVRKYMSDHNLTMTQTNRRALAAFIARPELANDLMITTMAVLPQQVNDKSNADRSNPLNDHERAEMATFRLTLFNSSQTPVDVMQGEFLPELVEVRTYDEVGTRPMPVMDHKGHLPVILDGIVAGTPVPLTLKLTIPPLSAETVVVWFRGTNKPSLTRVRGQLRLGEKHDAALSEIFTIIMHGDSP
ncbi:MAG: DUF4339 domain-containing protein [Planctomycetes bacterium]|nr:DUF4339 domain-containing protein [Planctomycetota bacterium]